MTTSNVNSVYAVIPVKDQEKAVQWYKKLLGRDADIVPVDSVAEWQLAENAWLQVTTDAEKSGNSTVIIGVNDIDIQCRTCAAADVPFGDLIEYPGIIKMIEVVDLDGNTVAFVQDISGQV